MKNLLILTTVLTLVTLTFCSISFAEKQELKNCLGSNCSYAHSTHKQRIAKNQKRGLITTARCPYYCSNEGLLEGKDCKEWQKGTRCYVENFTKGPGHRNLFRMPR